MKQSLEPLSFCHRWVPVKLGIFPEQRGYKAACIRFLAEITESSETTAKTWIYSPQRTPRIITLFLYNLDKLWRLESILLQATEIYLEDNNSNHE